MASGYYARICRAIDEVFTWYRAGFSAYCNSRSLIDVAHPKGPARQDPHERFDQPDAAAAFEYARRVPLRSGVNTAALYNEAEVLVARMPRFASRINRAGRNAAFSARLVFQQPAGDPRRMGGTRARQHRRPHLRGAVSPGAAGHDLCRRRFGRHLEGGTQDNGTIVGNDGAGSDEWRTIFGGDGSYGAVANNGMTIFAVAILEHRPIAEQRRAVHQRARRA